MLFAVNRTLMRGLCLNPNLLKVGATFVREAQTAPYYQLWSIGDHYPAMMRVPPQDLQRDPDCAASITLGTSPLIPSYALFHSCPSRRPPHRKL